MPESYRPTGSPPLQNGSVKTPSRKVVSREPKTSDRPKTSDGKKLFGEGGGSSGEGSSASTPKLTMFAHSRSQSDALVTPTKVNGEGFQGSERGQ